MKEVERGRCFPSLHAPQHPRVASGEEASEEVQARRRAIRSA